MKKWISCLLVLALIITAIPLVIASAEDGVFIVADGVTYQVQQGDVFDYVYYLNTGEQLCSIEGDFKYDPAGLELIIPENDDDFEEEMLFLRLKYSIMTHAYFDQGLILYNFSNANGVKCDKDYELIRAQFKVTAAKGTFEIRNHVYTVAGADEFVYLYQDQVLSPLKTNKGGIPELTPYEAPTEPVTAAPTEPVTAAPETQPTAAPTTPPTAPPTDPPTAAPTTLPTAPPTDPPTAAPTTPPTDPPTDPATAAPTTPPTDPPTDPVTAAPTTPPTAPPTDPATAAPTTPPTAPPTDPATAAPTTPPTAPPTDPATAAPTTPPTDPPADTRRYGDVDDDGDITIVDVSFIQRHLAGIIHFDADQLKYGDVDGDGEVTINDGTYIQRWLAGIKDDNPLIVLRGYPTP